ncbi:MAG: (Fe-S)-binding protein [Dehalococcoidales bacterium]|nr:MAG: (Fe-S)-binding protein [Dehalococcoidales bacterium]
MDERLSKTPMYKWGWGRWFEEKWFDEAYDSWSPEKVWDQVSQGELPYSVHRTRAMNLQRIGAKPTPGAVNVIVDGCANSGASGPVALGPYFQLLDALGIEYNLLPIRYCCGWTILGRATPDEWDDAVSKVKTLAEKNIDEARKLGARNVYQFCHMCGALAQYADTEGTGMTVGYGLDILTEPLKQVKKLKVAQPAKIGYYRGCLGLKKAMNPDFSFEFDTYRSWVDRIEGLEVMDLPDTICCQATTRGREDVKQLAIDNNLDYIVTPCLECRRNLDEAGQKVLLLGTLLLEAVTGNPTTRWSSLRV